MCLFVKLLTSVQLFLFILYLLVLVGNVLAHMSYFFPMPIYNVQSSLYPRFKGRTLLNSRDGNRGTLICLFAHIVCSLFAVKSSQR